MSIQLLLVWSYGRIDNDYHSADFLLLQKAKAKGTSNPRGRTIIGTSFISAECFPRFSNHFTYSIPSISNLSFPRISYCWNLLTIWNENADIRLPDRSKVTPKNSKAILSVCFYWELNSNGKMKALSLVARLKSQNSDHQFRKYVKFALASALHYDHIISRTSPFLL